jgi:hypothetical protein
VNIVAALLGLLSVVATGAAYWTYVFWPLIKKRRKLNALGEWRAALAQIPLVLSLAMVCLGYFDFIFFCFSPPAFVVSIFGYTLKYANFLYPIVLFSFTIALSVYYCFRLARPKLNYLAASIATTAFVGAFFCVADIRTRQLQRTAIQNEKFDCVSIKSFWFRSRHTDFRSEIDINTIGVKGNSKYIWSFASLDFHELYKSTSTPPLC